MSKILKAECEEGKVTCEGFEIPDVEILSQGVGLSDGILIIQNGKAFYFPSSAPDLNETLQKVSASLEKIADALNSLDTAGYIIAVAGGSGAPAVGTPSPPIIPSEISEIQGIKSELDELREKLR